MKMRLERLQVFIVGLLRRLLDCRDDGRQEMVDCRSKAGAADNDSIVRNVIGRVCTEKEYSELGLVFGFRIPFVELVRKWRWG